MDNNQPVLMKSLVAGINELKNNPQAQTVAGIDRVSFEMFVSYLTGTNDISHIEGLNFIESQLKLIPTDNPTLNSLTLAYNQLQEYHGVIEESILLLNAKRASPETIERKKAEWFIKSRAFTATTLNLPEEYLKNPKIISAVGKDLLGTRQITEENLSSRISGTLNPMLPETPETSSQIVLIAKNAVRLSTPKDLQFQRIILANLKRLLKFPGASSPGGIPYEAFELLVRRATGNPKLKLSDPDGLKNAITIISGIDRSSGPFQGTVSLYEMLKRRALHTRLKLLTQNNKPLSPHQEAIAANYDPEQIFLASVLTDLPDEFLLDRSFHDSLEKELGGYDMVSDKKREQSFLGKIDTAAKNSGKTITGEQLTKTATQASQNVNKVIPKGITLGQVALAVALSLSNLSTPQPSEEESAADEEEQGPSILSPAAGFALGALTDIGKPREEETEEEYLKAEEKAANIPPQPPLPTPSSPQIPAKTVIASQASGLFSKTFATVKLGLGKLATKLALALNPAGLIGLIGGSLLGRIFKRGSGQTGLPVDNTLRNVKIVILGIGAVAYVLLEGIPFFNSDGKAAAFVTEDNCRGTCPVVNPIIAQNPTTTPSQQEPNLTISPVNNIPSEPNLTPRGFPINSSCVTQRPGGLFSHKRANAVDVLVLGKNPDDLIIRVTHNGRVTFAGCVGDCTETYGYMATIQSPNKDFSTLYAHMQFGSLEVRVGDTVKRGDIIGIVNDTGHSTGDHLHYELRAGSNPGNYEQFGVVETILNFLPPTSTWQCDL